MAAPRPTVTPTPAPQPAPSAPAPAETDLPELESDRVHKRAVDFAASFRPVGEVEAFLSYQAATESVRIERLQQEERILLLKRTDQAARGWDEDRRLAAAELGARLARDPERTVLRLRQTTQGCDWLVDRWVTLADALADGKVWDDSQRSRVLDLLGVPVELRSCPTALDGPEGATTSERQMELACREIERLRKLQDEVMDERDETDRLAALRGMGAGDASVERALARVRRYEAACQRRMTRAMSLLLSGQVVDRMVKAKHLAAGAAPVLAEPVVVPAAAAEPAPAPSKVSERPVEPKPSPAVAAEPRATVAFDAPVSERPKGNRRWRKEQLRRDRERAAAATA